MKDEKKKNLLTNILSEYKKVIWPKKSEIFQVTVIVLLITLFVAALMLVFDVAFKNVIHGLSQVISKIFK